MLQISQQHENKLINQENVTTQKGIYSMRLQQFFEVMTGFTVERINKIVRQRQSEG